MTGISGGTFNPPTFWYEIQNDVFCIKKADFVDTTFQINTMNFLKEIYKGKGG